MLAIGFVLGIIVGVLYFEIFSIKNPKTFEDAEALLALKPPDNPQPDYSNIEQKAAKWTAEGDCPLCFKPLGTETDVHSLCAAMENNR